MRRAVVVVLAPDTALPPAGRYRALVGGQDGLVEIDTRGQLTLLEHPRTLKHRIWVSSLGHET